MRGGWGGVEGVVEGWCWEWVVGLGDEGLKVSRQCRLYMRDLYIGIGHERSLKLYTTVGAVLTEELRCRFCGV